MTPRPQRPRLPGVCRWIVAIASALVPEHARDEWRREWLSELSAQWIEGDDGATPRAALGWGLLRRSLLSVGDAARLASAEAAWGLMGTELRLAVRSLMRRPVPTASIGTLLGLCVATATVVLSLAEGILRRPPPWAEPDEVVLVTPRSPEGDERLTNVSAAEYLELERRAKSFARIGAIDRVERTFLTAGPPVELPGALVSSSTFDVLGVPAAVGRTFLDAEDRPGGPDVIVLSDALWRGAFGADPSVLGTEVRLDDGTYRVVGVMPPGFLLPDELDAVVPSDFFLPLAVDRLDPGPFFVKNLDAVVARLRPGRDSAAAGSEVASIADGIISEHPDNYDPDAWTLAVASPVEEAVSGARPTLRMLVWAVGLLVLAVCANLAGLLSSRAAGRRREVAVRTALGARPLHIVRRMSFEAVLLVVFGGTLGILGATYALPLVLSVVEDVLPRTHAVELELEVALVVLGVALATAMLFSVAPALGAARAGRGSAAARGPGGVGRRGRLQRASIAGQLAVASVLLCLCVLLARSLERLITLHPGFRQAGVQTVELSLPSSRYGSVEEVEAFYRRLVDEISREPGVEEVGLARRRPMADRYGTWTMAVQGEGEPRRLDDAPPRWQVATPGYFRALDIPLVDGRLYTEQELDGPAGVAVVNRAFAASHWPARSAVGTRIRMDGGPNNPWLTVVGVVGDVRMDGPRAGTDPVVYLPHPHFAEATSVGTQRSMSLVLRTTLDSDATRALVESRLGSLDQTLPHGGVVSMEQIVAASFAETRILAQVLSLFAVITLILGAVGVYATLSYEVSIRARELGVRSALGAGRARLLRLVVGDGLVIAGTGALVGTGVAALLAESLAGHLFRIGPRDPATFLVVPLVLLVAAATASYVPGRRAADADPVVPLRME